MSSREPRAELLADTGEFPNSAFPALFYAKALAPAGDLASAFEALFAAHGWSGCWRF